MMHRKGLNILKRLEIASPSKASLPTSRSAEKLAASTEASTPRRVLDEPSTPVRADAQEPGTPIRPGAQEPGTPIRSETQEPSTPIREEAPSSKPAVTLEPEDKPVSMIDKVQNALKLQLQPLKIGEPRFISVKSNDGLREKKLVVRKTQDFIDSDGNMSDIHVVQVSPHGDPTALSKTMLVKSIQTKRQIISNRLQLALQEILREKRRNKLKSEAKTLPDEHRIAAVILKEMQETLANEHAVASQMFDEETHLFDNSTKMLMPLFPGKKLFDEQNIEYLKTLSYEKLLQFASKIVDELYKMHELDIGHFDVKPENILLDQKSESIRLIDFGTSFKLSGKSDILKDKRGTPAYMSPETLQASTAQLGLKSDIFAIGIILERLLIEIPNKEIESPIKSLAHELIQQFIYRMQGKDKTGKLIPYSKTYMSEVYDKIRPEHDEPKLFFDSIKDLILVLNSSNIDKESQIEAIATKLKTFVTPAHLRSSPAAKLSESTLSIFSVDTTDIDIGIGQSAASFTL